MWTYLDADDVLVGFVGSGAGDVQLTGNDQCPFIGAGDAQQAIFTSRDLCVADGDGVTESEGRGLVGACAPYFAEWDKVSKYFSAFYSRSGIGQLDRGETKVLFYILGCRR